MKKSSQNSLINKIEEYLQQGKRRFCLREISEDANVSLIEAENFFIPILKKNELEGSLEIRCPRCGTQIGTYKKYSEIPHEFECEFCEVSFPLSDNLLEVVLEVKKNFFRTKHFNFGA